MGLRAWLRGSVPSPSGSRWDRRSVGHSRSPWRVHGDCLLAKSAHGVQYRPWRGPDQFAGPLQCVYIRARWCQSWVSYTPATKRHFTVKLHLTSRKMGFLLPSQITMRPARVLARLTCTVSYVSISWRPPLATVVVTHLVTRLMRLSMRLGCLTCPGRSRRRYRVNMHTTATMTRLGAD